MLHPIVDDVSKNITGEPANGQVHLPTPAPFPAMEPREMYRRRGVNWRVIIWIVFATLGAIALVAAYGQGIIFNSADEQTAASKPSFVIPVSPTYTPTPTATSKAAAVEGANDFAFLQPTATPTPVSNGRLLVLTPAARDSGWVVSDDESIVTSYDPQNHFGDSFLYAGVLGGKVYHGAIQFDLGRIPRGTKIYAASLRLTGLRADQLNQAGEGGWQLQLLSSEIDENWRSLNYQQIHHAAIGSTFEPPLTQEELGQGQVNLFEFSPEQLALLERRIIEGSDEFGRTISFRLDGPTEGSDSLFAWDSGYGAASQETGPELFLSLGPPPQETPLPYYVVVTSTPTPEHVMTAMANSLQMTAEAKRIGTATSVPPSWVTPVVVTVTPTPENQATAQSMSGLATAIALTTGEPPNMATATPTPTYMIITSTPTPEDIMTAVAEAWQVTAEATRLGTATPLPPNWVTPVVVTSTPAPANNATVEYLQAVILTTGTPTPTPGNVQTATPTPIFIAAEPFALPTVTATPTATPQPIPAVLLGKIVFLSDREGATEEERLEAEEKKATPQITPQPYMFDPVTGQLARLTDIGPYEVAAAREAWSADRSYWAYTTGPPDQKKKLAIYYYDYRSQVEYPLTRMGAGIAYDSAWSPINDEIAFVSTESRNDEIWVVQRDGSGLLQLTRNEWEWDKHPSWSPDGQQIVFFSNRTGNSQLWIMNKDGSGQRLLMELNPYNDWNPVWIKYLEPAIPPARPTPTLNVVTGTLTLLDPVNPDVPSYGPTDFEWRWTGPVPAGVGFEVRVWREGEQPAGIHDAVLDNQNGTIKSNGANEYRLSVDIRSAAGVQGQSGTYLWTVALVQINPNYADLGQQAPPAQLRFDASGSGQQQ
jgi:hypothetical protein